MKAIREASEGQGNLLPVTGLYVLENLEVLQTHGIPVYQVFKGPDGTLRADPVDPALARTLPPQARDHKQFLIDKDWKAGLFAAADTFEAQLAPLLDQSPEKRTQAVRALKDRMAELKASDIPAGEKAQAIMETVGQTFLLNKASLKLKPLEVTDHERAVARNTESIVHSALEMADDPELVAGLFAGFQGLSNGQTVNHVLRVFSSYSGFLKHYQTLHQKRLSQVLRRVFPTVYKATYHRILPALDDHLLVSDNLLQLPDFEVEDQKEFALGAFLHDIGKMANIDYFESDAAYDPKQIRQHAYLSAGLILMNYGNEHNGARLLAGDHHNALGHEAGYGITRLERERSKRPLVDTVRVLSSSPMGYVSGEALGWLPVEMLAVADVYDAMVDDSRSYKKAMTPAEAVVFLEQTMAAQGKLDPVLVDLFIDYLRTQGVPVPADRGFHHKAQA